MANRLGWRKSLVLAAAACLAASYGLSFVRLDLGATLVLSAIVLALVVAAAAAVSTPNAEGPSPGHSRRGLALKMVVASGIVVCVTVASTVLGSQMSGMLTAIPMITAVMVVSSHRAGGFGSARRLLRGTVAGLWGGGAFFAVVGLLVSAATPGITYLVATAAAALVALAVVGLVDDAHAAGAELTPDAKARAAERMGPEEIHDRQWQRG